MSSGGCLSLPRGYIHVYDHNIQTSLTAWQVKAKLYQEHREEREMRVNINGSGHVTKMAAMAINSKKTFFKYFSEPEDL